VGTAAPGCPGASAPEHSPLCLYVPCGVENLSLRSRPSFPSPSRNVQLQLPHNPRQRHQKSFASLIQPQLGFLQKRASPILLQPECILVRKPSQNDDCHSLRRWILLQRLQHFRPRNLRQQHVQQDQVRLLPPRQFQRALSICRRAHAVSRPCQRPLHRHSQELAVIHQQNLRHARGIFPSVPSPGSRTSSPGALARFGSFNFFYRQNCGADQQAADQIRMRYFSGFSQELTRRLTPPSFDQTLSKR